MHLKPGRSIDLVRFLPISVAMVVLSSAAWALDPVNKTPDGLGLKGYDPVAYFTEGKPVKGFAEFLYEWIGAKWYFSSAANRDLFAANPEKYAPQYGGYCAYAVSKGHTADINPSVWKIVAGKLYLNNGYLAGKLWQHDIPGNIEKADKNWPKLLGQ